MALEITVHTKDQCTECTKTKKTLQNKNIPHRTVHVADDNVELIEDLRSIADQLGSPLTMPYVKVVDTETGDAQEWFGHRTDLIVQRITSKRIGA